MKEITQARIILSTIESQIDYVIEKAQEINNNYIQLQEQYKQLQMKYDEAIKQIEVLSKDDKHNTNNQES